MMYDIWVWCLQQGLNLYIEKPHGPHACTRRARWPTWPRSTAASPRSASSGAPARWWCKLRDECLKRGPIVHAVCQFYKCSLDALSGRARPHDGRRRARHRHAALDVRRRGGERAQRLTQRVRHAGHQLHPAALLEFDNGATGAADQQLDQRAAHLPPWRCTRRASAPRPSTRARARSTPTATPRAWRYDTRAGGRQRRVCTSTAAFRPRTASSSTPSGPAPSPARTSRDAVKTMEVAETILAQALLDGGLSHEPTVLRCICARRRWTLTLAAISSGRCHDEARRSIPSAWPSSCATCGIGTGAAGQRSGWRSCCPA